MADPASGFPTTFEGRTASRLKQLEARVDAMDRARHAVTVGSGAPGATVTTPFYIDEVAHRLYWRETSSWRWTQGT